MGVMAFAQFVPVDEKTLSVAQKKSQKKSLILERHNWLILSFWAIAKGIEPE